jgi:hypothetical protein
MARILSRCFTHVSYFTYRPSLKEKMRGKKTVVRIFRIFRIFCIFRIFRIFFSFFAFFCIFRIFFAFFAFFCIFRIFFCIFCIFCIFRIFRIFHIFRIFRIFRRDALYVSRKYNKPVRIARDRFILFVTRKTIFAFLCFDIVNTKTGVEVI